MPFDIHSLIHIMILSLFSRHDFVSIEIEELHRLGRDYPDESYHFNQRLRRAFESESESRFTPVRHGACMSEQGERDCQISSLWTGVILLASLEGALKTLAGPAERTHPSRNKNPKLTFLPFLPYPLDLFQSSPPYVNSIFQTLPFFCP